MAGGSESAGRVSEFRVVCRGRQTAAYILHRSAKDPASAMDSARQAGHEPFLCMPFGLSRADETRILSQWRFGSKQCAGCGYSLAGLPEAYCVTCPECGLGTVTTESGIRPRGEPHCADCGYCMTGIATGGGAVRCPECGSTNPFLRRKRGMA